MAKFIQTVEEANILKEKLAAKDNLINNQMHAMANKIQELEERKEEPQQYYHQKKFSTVEDVDDFLYNKKAPQYTEMTNIEYLSKMISKKTGYNKDKLFGPLKEFDSKSAEQKFKEEFNAKFTTPAARREAVEKIMSYLDQNNLTAYKNIQKYFTELLNEHKKTMCRTFGRHIQNT